MGLNLLRQSTSQVVRFGPFLDSTDGVTPETGLTIAQADMQLSKDGATFAQKNATGNATHDIDGWYSTTLNTTDTGTNAILQLQITVAGALPVWVEYYVVPAASYDAITTDGLFNFDPATDAVANVTDVGTVATVTAFSTAAILSIWDQLTSALTTASTIGKLIVDNLNATISSRANEINATTNTTNIIANTDAETALLATPAQVNAQMLDVLTVDTFAEPTSVPPATTTIINKISWNAALARNKLLQTNALQSLRNDADGADIATAVLIDDGTTFTRNEFT